MAYISYETNRAEYRRLWDTMKIIRDQAELQRVSDKIQRFRHIYQNVERECGVPWQMVAVIHLREAGEQDIGKWQCVLHNGEKIVGTQKKTRLVPAGRGPFATWHEAAVHALKEKAFDKIKDWPVERMLWAMEPFNGYGYRNKGLRSPYLWASTNHQQPGKYVADHVFDASKMDTQVGCAAQLKYLGVGQKASTGAGTAATTIAAGAGLGAYFWDHIVPISIGTAVAAIAIYLLVRWYKTRIKTQENNNVQENMGHNNITLPMDSTKVDSIGEVGGQMGTRPKD